MKLLWSLKAIEKPTTINHPAPSTSSTNGIIQQHLSPPPKFPYGIFLTFPPYFCILLQKALFPFFAPSFWDRFLLLNKHFKKRKQQKSNPQVPLLRHEDNQQIFFFSFSAFLLFSFFFFEKHFTSLTLTRDWFNFHTIFPSRWRARGCEGGGKIEFSHFHIFT